MGCRILHDDQAGLATFYCSASDWAFGPVFYRDETHDAETRADAFHRWVLSDACPWTTLDRHALLDRGRHDPRVLTDAGLERAYTLWRAQEAAQWAREEAAVAETET